MAITEDNPKVVDTLAKAVAGVGIPRVDRLPIVVVAAEDSRIPACLVAVANYLGPSRRREPSPRTEQLVWLIALPSLWHEDRG